MELVRRRRPRPPRPLPSVGLTDGLRPAERYQLNINTTINYLNCMRALQFHDRRGTAAYRDLRTTADRRPKITVTPSAHQLAGARQRKARCRGLRDEPVSCQRSATQRDHADDQSEERRTFDQSGRNDHAGLNVSGDFRLTSHALDGRRTDPADAEAGAQHDQARTDRGTRENIDACRLPAALPEPSQGWQPPTGPERTTRFSTT